MGIQHQVGLRIAAARKRRGLTQEDLAELLERSAETVSSLERGKNKPSFDTLERLSNALEVPIRDFFDFPEPGGTDMLRARRLIELTEAARTLSKKDLDLAVKLIGLLAAECAGRR